MSQPSSNFSFLNFANPQLANLGTLAERYLTDDPNTCLVKLRQFAEKLAQDIATRLNIFESVQEEQLSLLNRLQLQIDNRIIRLFHDIRLNGNKAIHEQKGDYNLAVGQLKNAHQLATWYYKQYHNPNFKPEAFIIPSPKAIIDAKIPSSSSYQEVEQNIQQVTNGLKTIATLIGKPQKKPFVLNSGDSILPGVGMLNEADLLNLRAGNIQKGIFNLIVMGEFKNGKSTLLNAMLGDKKLPAKANPATAIITMLVYGNQQQVSVYKVNNKTPEVISLEEFNQKYQLTYEDQETLNSKSIIDRFKDIEFAQIQCQNDLCRSGVRLIDSPGLAEQISRTKLSTNFLKQSQAVIMVLNATQPLTQEERNFIETNFQGKNNNNLFFVINRINQIDPDDAPEVKQYFRRYLQQLFVDSNQYLVHHRIFYVNAKAALDARLKIPVDIQLLDDSGLLELEKELEKFLTSGQRFNAVVSSNLNSLNLILNELQRKVELNKQALGEPLEELEKRRLEVEGRLQRLEAREPQIVNIINVYNKTIADKLCLSLDNYIQLMRDKWYNNSQDFIDFSDFNILEISQSLISQTKKEELTRKVQKGIKEYLEYHLTNWAEAIPVIIRKEVEELNKILETSLTDFNKEIINIESFFSSSKGEIIKTGNDNLSVIFSRGMLEELGHLPGTIMMDLNWFSFFGRSILQFFLLNIFATIFSGPIPWVIFLIAEFFTIKGSFNRKNKIIEKTGEKLFQELDLNLVEFQWQIRENLDQQLQSLATNITDSLQKQVNEVRYEQTRIINQKREQSFSVEEEGLRLDRIIEETSRVFQNINKIIKVEK